MLYRYAKTTITSATGLSKVDDISLLNILCTSKPKTKWGPILKQVFFKINKNKNKNKLVNGDRIKGIRVIK